MRLKKYIKLENWKKMNKNKLKKVMPVLTIQGKKYYQVIVASITAELPYVISTDEGKVEICRFKNNVLSQPLQFCTTNGAYPSVLLTHEEGKTKRYVHTIVADTFLKFPKGFERNKLHVNHIDGNTENALPENLEFTSPTGNALHSFDIGTRKKSRGLIDYNVYKFFHDDGTEFQGTAREFFYTFCEKYKLLMAGVNNLIRGYHLTTGANYYQHKGWRYELVRKRTVEEYRDEISKKPVGVYQKYQYAETVPQYSTTMKNYYKNKSKKK